MPSWMVTLTEPIGSGWYQGQLALGAELVAFRTSEPITAYGAGFTPKLVYTSTALDVCVRFSKQAEGRCRQIWAAGFLNSRDSSIFSCGAEPAVLIS